MAIKSPFGSWPGCPYGLNPDGWSEKIFAWILCQKLISHTPKLYNSEWILSRCFYFSTKTSRTEQKKHKPVSFGIMELSWFVLQIRVCSRENTGAANALRLFQLVQSDLQTSQWSGYFWLVWFFICCVVVNQRSHRYASFLRLAYKKSSIVNVAET